MEASGSGLRRIRGGLGMAGVGGGRADRVQEPWVWDFRAESLRGSATSWCLRPGVPKLQSLSLLKEPMRTQGIFLKKRIFGNGYAQGLPPMVLTQDALVPFAGWSSQNIPQTLLHREPNIP